MPMDKADLERFQNGLASGNGEDSAVITQGSGEDEVDYEYNLVGATNEMLNVLDDMEQYDLTWSDLSQEQQNAVDRGQQAMQQQMSALSDLFSQLAGEDGSVVLDDGREINLPNQASDTANKNAPQ